MIKLDWELNGERKLVPYYIDFEKELNLIQGNPDDVVLLEPDTSKFRSYIYNLSDFGKEINSNTVDYIENLKLRLRLYGDDL